MKKLITILLLILLLVGCKGAIDCSRGAEPHTPTGWERSEYTYGDYKSITFTNYNSRKYISETWVSDDDCDEWKEYSHYEGN